MIDPERHQPIDTRPYYRSVNGVLAALEAGESQASQEDATLHLIETMREPILDDYREHYASPEAAAFDAALNLLKGMSAKALTAPRTAMTQYDVSVYRGPTWAYDKIATSESGTTYRQVNLMNIGTGRISESQADVAAGVAVARGGVITKKAYPDGFFGIKPPRFGKYDQHTVQAAFLEAIFKSPPWIMISSHIEIIGEPGSTTQVCSAGVDNVELYPNAMPEEPTFTSQELKELLEIAPLVHSNIRKIYKYLGMTPTSAGQSVIPPLKRNLQNLGAVIATDVTTIAKLASQNQEVEQTDLHRVLNILDTYGTDENELMAITDLLQFRYNQFRAIKGKSKIERLVQFNNLLHEVETSNPVIAI